MNKMYTKPIHFRKLTEQTVKLCNREALPMPHLPDEIYRIAELMDKLEGITPSIPNSSVRRIFEKLKLQQ